MTLDDTLCGLDFQNGGTIMLKSEGLRRGDLLAPGSLQHGRSDPGLAR